MHQARTEAYARLKELVQKTHGGLRLAFLAAELRTGGHFDKVIRMIDRMIEDLRVEEQEDIKAKDVCELQENALENQEDDLDYNIKKKGDEKDRMEAEKSELEKKIDAIKKDIEETMGTMKETKRTEWKPRNQSLRKKIDAIKKTSKKP